MKYFLEAYLKGTIKEPNRHKELRSIEKSFVKFETDLTDEEDYRKKQLPFIFQLLWGKIDKRKMAILSRNPTWTDLRAKVCENCFLLLTKE